MQKNKHKISGVIIEILEEQEIIKNNKKLINIYFKLDDNSICLLKEQNFNILNVGDRIKVIGDNIEQVLHIDDYINLSTGYTTINSNIRKGIFMILLCAFFTLMSFISVVEVSKYSNAYAISKGFSYFFLIVTIILIVALFFMKKNKKWLLEDDFKEK